MPWSFSLNPARATVDLDVTVRWLSSGRTGTRAAVRLLRQAAELSLGDFFEYRVSNTAMGRAGPRTAVHVMQSPR